MNPTLQGNTPHSTLISHPVKYDMGSATPVGAVGGGSDTTKLKPNVWNTPPPSLPGHGPQYQPWDNNLAYSHSALCLEHG